MKNFPNPPNKCTDFFDTVLHREIFHVTVFHSKEIFVNMIYIVDDLLHFYYKI